jgi:hypothetical protein
MAGLDCVAASLRERGGGALTRRDDPARRCRRQPAELYEQAATYPDRDWLEITRSYQALRFWIRPSLVYCAYGRAGIVYYW